MVDHADAPAPPPATGQETASDLGGGERVAKALARAGVASRREVERYIAEGRVKLNGRVLDTPAVKIEAGDVLLVDGRPVAATEPTRVWRYHKPVGLVTTHKDPQGRPTVFDALPPGLPRVISIGRLDLNSEGLLLLTNDGRLSRALELPSSGWVRRYRARAYGRTSQEALDRLQNGITVEGVAYGPIEARLDKVQRKAGDAEASSANCWITVALKEGKNREVRRVLEALGLKVNRLVRLAYGPFALATLPLGALEEVGPRVIREQLADFIAPEDLPTGERAVGPVALAGRRPSGPVSAGDGGVAPAKKVYKPGWAKPAKRPARAPLSKSARRKAEGPAEDAVMHARPQVSRPGPGGRMPGAAGHAQASRPNTARGRSTAPEPDARGREVDKPRTPRPAGLKSAQTPPHRGAPQGGKPASRGPRTSAPGAPPSTAPRSGPLATVQAAHAALSPMRITSGQYRGKPLRAPPGASTRPTSDKARQAVFNILEHAPWAPGLHDARVIDLFAGTGALGLEAISRGAAFCLFVETDEAARGAIRDNVEACDLFGRTRIHRRDATDLGERPGSAGGVFSLALLDPPYGKGLGEKALTALVGGGWLAAGAICLLERGPGESALAVDGFELLDQRSYGVAEVSFLRFAQATQA